MSEIPKVLCSRCKIDKEPFHFPPANLKRGGARECRKCQSERNKARYIKAYTPSDFQFGTLMFGGEK